MRRKILPVIAAATLTVGAIQLGAQGVRVALPGWTDPVLLDSLRQDHPIAAAPEAVYAAVEKTFADLGIPAGRADSKAGIIGSERFERMRVLSGAPMSRVFSCGESATGNNADAYRLSIAIVTWVATGKDGATTLGIAAAASGADISGVSRTPRACVSTGWIEEKIAAGVRKRVGA